MDIVKAREELIKYLYETDPANTNCNVNNTLDEYESEVDYSIEQYIESLGLFSLYKYLTDILEVNFGKDLNHKLDRKKINEIENYL